MKAPSATLTFTSIGAGAPGLREAWIEVWTAASNAGGAIGFAAPVTARDIEPLVDREVDYASQGRSVICMIRGLDDEALAFAVLRYSTSPSQQHWAALTRVMVDPAHQGRGIGRQVVEGVHEMARRLGLSQLRLTARGGQGLETFYERLGYRIIGRHPDAVQTGPDEFRDTIFMLHLL